jgi:hypothetical protein
MNARYAIPLLRTLLVAGALVTCLAFAAVAAAAVKLVDPSVVASGIAAKPIAVSVNAYGPGTWGGGAFVGSNHIFLGEDAYRDAERGGGVGLFLLLHETGHTTGIAGEHAADCFSLAHIKLALRRFWHLRPEQIDRRYGDALAWPGKYDGNRCDDLAKRRALARAS